MKHRNVVYFFDGTTQCRSKDEYSDWSNIVRLHGLLSRTAPDGTEQWSNYVDGVGCRVNEKILGSSAGVGLEKRVEEAYLHLGTMVRDAKRLGLELRVYLFGFSRGAYAARWFAALVDMCGVPSNGVSSSFFWSVAGLFTKGAVHAERESEVGDVFHWQVHGLRDMFVDVEPALPPEDMIVYSRPMNPGVMMA